MAIDKYFAELVYTEYNISFNISNSELTTSKFLIIPFLYDMINFTLKEKELIKKEEITREKEQRSTWWSVEEGGGGLEMIFQSEYEYDLLLFTVN